MELHFAVAELGSHLPELKNSDWFIGKFCGTHWGPWQRTSASTVKSLLIMKGTALAFSEQATLQKIDGKILRILLKLPWKSSPWWVWNFLTDNTNLSQWALLLDITCLPCFS